MKFIYDILIHRQKLLIVAGIAMLTILAAFTRIPEIDGRLTGFNFEVTGYYKDGVAIAEEFGATKFIQLNLVPENVSIGEVISTLEKLDSALSNEFKGMRIRSLHDSGKLLKISDKSKEPVSDVLKRAAGLPLVKDLVARDTSAFLFIAFIDDEKAFDVKQFDSIVKSTLTENIKNYNTLSPFHVEEAIADSIRRDIVVLSAVIMAFFVLLISLIYRSFAALVFAMVIIGVCLFPIAALLYIFDIPLNLITVLTVPVVLVLSLADAIHLLTGYRSVIHLDKYEDRLQYVLKRYFVPSLFTSLTTAVAFFSFYFNDSENIRNFGFLTGVSVLLAFVMTYIFGPFLLRYVRPARNENHFLNRIYRHLEKYRVGYSIGFGIMLVSSLFFVSSIRFNTNTDTFIPRKTQLRIDQQELTSQYYSQLRLELVLIKKQSLSSRDLQNMTVDLHKKLERLSEVGRVSSVKDQLDYKSRFGALSGFIRFPSKDNPYYNQSKNAFRLDIRLKDAADLKKVEADIRSLLLNYQDKVDVKLFSNGLLIDEVNSRVAESLLYSMLFSCLFITLLILLMTRSVVQALITVIANIAPLSAVVLIFTGFGLDMNLLTAITAVVCVGLIVDDTIHVLYRKLILKTELDELSFGVITTSLILFGGFLSFALSSFVPSQTFGVICAVIFILTVISDLTLLPYLIDKFVKKS